MDTRMPHAFDMSGLADLIAELGKLAEHAREQEQRLAELISATHAAGLTEIGVASPDAVAEGTPSANALAAAGIAPAGPVLAVHALCVAAAREHRQMLQQLIARLDGGTDGDGMPDATHSVLVVDDSDDSRDLAATILDAYGFRVRTANNGLEAIIAAHCTSPSAIVMDINMPVLNGIEAARLLKASPVTRAIDVFAYTANPGFYDGPLSGLFADVLTKPVRPDEIAQLVLQAVSRRSGDQQRDA